LAGGGYGVRGGNGVRVLNAYETDPDVWRIPMRGRLGRPQVLASGLEMDEEIRAAGCGVSPW
jgi:hypothetical protein